MKTVYILFFGFILMSQIGFAQNRHFNNKIYKPNHIEPEMIGLNFRNTTDFSTKLDSIKSESHCLSFEYDYAGRLLVEKNIDKYDPTFTWKSEYVKNANGITERINSYSYLSNQFVMTCYQEFEIDSLGRRTQRINVNYISSSWEIGGKGFYYYYPDGKLKEYKQLIHLGSDVYDDLSREIYEYDSITGLLKTVTYLYCDYGTWDTSMIDSYYYNGNVLSYVTSRYNDYGTWKNDHKFEYDHSALGNYMERRYYPGSGTSSWDSVSDKYVWRYDETQSSANVLFPHEAESFMLDFTWFDMTNLRTEEDWYTIDQNTMQLAFIETATYYYSPVSGIDNFDNDEVVKVYPNPTSDKINFSSDLNYKNISVDVLSIDGKKMASFNNIPDDGISVTDWPSGLYVVLFNSDKVNIKPQKIQIR